MASGIKVSDEVKTAYQNISRKSSKSTKMKFGVFKFSDDLKNIVVEKVVSQDEAPQEATELDAYYNSIVEGLPSNDVRYVVYDFDYLNKDKVKTSDIIMVSWHPEGCSVKAKMLVASSLNALKSSLGISKNVLEGDDLSEVDVKAALEKLGGTSLSPA